MISQELKSPSADSIIKMKKIGRTLKIISHPVRLNILILLDEFSSLSVNDMKLKMKEKIDQPLLSNHLTKLKNGGIITFFKQGRRVTYLLKDKNIPKVIECMENSSSLRE